MDRWRAHGIIFSRIASVARTRAPITRFSVQTTSFRGIKESHAFYYMNIFDFKMIVGGQLSRDERNALNPSAKHYRLVCAWCGVALHITVYEWMNGVAVSQWTQRQTKLNFNELSN